MIHTAGAFALDCLTNALDCGDVATLIQQNADYVAFYVNMSLKKVRLLNSGISGSESHFLYSSLI